MSELIALEKEEDLAIRKGVRMTRFRDYLELYKKAMYQIEERSNLINQLFEDLDTAIDVAKKLKSEALNYKDYADKFDNEIHTREEILGKLLGLEYETDGGYNFYTQIVPEIARLVERNK